MKIEMCDEFYYRINDENLNIDKVFNTCKENVLRNNENIKLYSGEWVKIKVNDFQTHYVKPAETLYEIAKKYNVEVETLKENNNLLTDKLFIGQCIRIYNDKINNK